MHSTQATRRQLFAQTALTLAPAALAALCEQNAQGTESSPSVIHAPQTRCARSVIFLNMIGGPSQIDLFDPKPEVNRRSGEPLPDSLLKKASFAQIQEQQPRLMGSPWRFRRHGESGTAVSELMPYLSTVVDQLSMVRTIRTDDTNHMFAELMLNTGWRRFGRPSLGSWVVYGLGSESQQLPAFLVLRSGMRPRSKSANYSNGFLPSRLQGTPLQTVGDPIINLTNPPGIEAPQQHDTVDAVNALNRIRLEHTGDEEIAGRIASYEMAFRMQSAATEWLDLSQESAYTLEQYGIAETGQPSYGRNCLLARRLVERGVRFIQLFHGDWDHHSNIQGSLPAQCRTTDQPTAALLRDLKQRGLLNETLVIWGGELGRGPVAQNSDKPGIATGRDHQIAAFTMWFAGGGVRRGQTIGATDDFGCLPVTESWHIHDIHATLLHLLGLDHTKLTYRFSGRDFRLTDVHGRIVDEILA